MRILIIAIAALSLLSSCISGDNEHLPGAPTDAAAPIADAMPPSPDALPIPAQVGDYCTIACDAEHWYQPGGGDDQCYAATGSAKTCCLGTGMCGVGVRFEGPCFAVAPPPDSEVCPTDGDGDGLCQFDSYWYKTCPAGEDATAR